MPFRDIEGHRRVLELIARAASRGTLPPSLIFAGPEGIGKRMAAVALAQLMNCLEPGTFDGLDACGECGACKRIARGVHADVLLLEPGDTGAIKIDQVRDAIERSAYRPFEGRRRVVIVNDAEALNAEAQNALLKTLEEPPTASTFVLVTSRPDMLLPTVVSRCQRLRFGRLSPGEVAASLIRDHEYADGDAHAAASLSDGSIGRALQGATDEFVDAREAAVNLLDAVASSKDPWQRLGGAKALAGSARGGSSDREELARRLYALSSIKRSK